MESPFLSYYCNTKLYWIPALNSAWSLSKERKSKGGKSTLNINYRTRSKISPKAMNHLISTSVIWEIKNISRRNLEIRISTQPTETPKSLVSGNQNRNLPLKTAFNDFFPFYLQIKLNLPKDWQEFKNFDSRLTGIQNLFQISIALYKLGKLCIMKGWKKLILK